MLKVFVLTVLVAILYLEIECQNPQTAPRRRRTTIPMGYKKYRNVSVKVWQKQVFNIINDSFLPVLGQPGSNCTACPSVYIPICGTNGKSYTNKCYMVCENDTSVGVQYMGACFDFGIIW